MASEQGLLLVQQLISNSIDPSSEWSESLREEVKALDGELSPQARFQASQIAARVAEKEGEVEKGLTLLWELTTNPTAALSEIVRQGPVMAGMIGATLAGGAGAGLVFGAAARASPALAVANAISQNTIRAGVVSAGAVGAGRTAGAVASGGDAAGQVFEELTSPTMRQKMLANPDVQALMAEGRTEDEAVREIALARARIAQGLAGTAGFLLGATGLERVVARRAAGVTGARGSGLLRGAVAAGSEVLGQTADEVATQMAANRGVQGIDPTRPLMQGTGEAAATSLITTLPFAAAAGVSAAQPDTQREAYEQSIDGYARRALTPDFYDSRAVDPVTQREQFAAGGEPAPRAPDAPSRPPTILEQMGVTPVDGGKPTEPTKPTDAPAAPAITPVAGQGNEFTELAGEIRQQEAAAGIGRTETADVSATGSPELPVAGDGAQSAGAQSAGGLGTGGPDARSLGLRPGPAGTGAGSTAPAAPAASGPGAGAVTSATTNDQAPSTSAATVALGQLGVTGSPVRDVRDGGGQSDGQGAAGASGGAPARSIGQLRKVYELQRRRYAESAAAERAEAERLRQAGNEAEAKAAEGRAAFLEFQSARLPDMKEPPKGKALDQFNALADAWEQRYGVRPRAYFDSRQEATDGFADQEGGEQLYVNLANPARSVAFTIAHEYQHLVRRRAKAGDRQARLATQMLDQVWGMIPQAYKSEYASNYLMKAQIQSGVMTLDQALQDPVLQDEILSDFMGQRMEDRIFLEGLAKKNPQTFGAFIRDWIGTLNNLIKSLVGTMPADKSIKNADAALEAAGRLERARAVAEKVLQTWARANPQLAAEQGVSTDADPAGRSDSARAAYEVAPDPNDEGATREWNARSAEDRRQTTYEVDEQFFGRIARAVGVDPSKFRPVQTLGGFQGEINPSVVQRAEGATDEEIVRLSEALAYVYNQQSVLAVLAQPAEGSMTSDVVSIALNVNITPELARRVYDAIMAEPANEWVVGFTALDRNIDIVSVGETLSEAQVSAVARALEGISEVDSVRPADPANVIFVEGKVHEGQGASEGRPGERAGQRQGRDSLDAIRREVQDAAARRRAGAGPDAAGGGRNRSLGRQDVAEGGQGRADSAREQDGVTPTYGTPRDGAVSAVGYHYSTADRSTLVSSMYGRGLAGAEAERLRDSDPRLQQRIYFYVDRGTGINPESGVGGRGHRVELANLYDADEDALRLARDSGSHNAFELAVIEAGFDGYLKRDAGPSGNAVLLGQHNVRVEQLGPTTRTRSPRTVPPARPRQLNAAERMLTDRSLPAGQMSGPRWATLLQRLKPEEFAPFAASPVWEEAGPYYKDELLRRLKRPEMAFSGREEMGAFNPFLNDEDLENWDGDSEVVVADDAMGDLDAWEPEPEPQRPPSIDIQQMLQEELRAEQAAQAPPRAQAAQPADGTQLIRQPTDEELEAVGPMAEDAFPDIRYREDGFARVRIEGIPRDFFLQAADRGDNSYARAPDVQAFGTGVPISLGSTSRGVRDYHRRMIAASALFTRGFDLFTSVPRAARRRVAEAWVKIRGVSGAAEFQRSIPREVGESMKQRFQRIADEMLVGTPFTMRVSLMGGDWFSIMVRRGNEDWQEANLEVANSKQMVFHTAGLERGSSAGKAVYQVGAAFAAEAGMTIIADPTGLTGINTYRRSEQMFSAAVRAGASGMSPGIGQRVYGWNERATGDEQHERNMVRLALATARNAAELVPEVRDMSYDIGADRFEWRRERSLESPEDLLRRRLADKDVRAVGISRSTLARAAITWAAVENRLELDGIERAERPILYSAREQVIDDVEADFDGVMVRQPVMIQETGQTGYLTVDAGAALRDLSARTDALRRTLSCVAR